MVTTTQTYPTAVAACPRCGAHGALVWLGRHAADPNHWLQWATTVTHSYACVACRAVTRLVEIEGRSAPKADHRQASSYAEATAQLHWRRLPAVR